MYNTISIKINEVKTKKSVQFQYLRPQLDAIITNKVAGQLQDNKINFIIKPIKNKYNIFPLYTESLYDLYNLFSHLNLPTFPREDTSLIML